MTKEYSALMIAGTWTEKKEDARASHTMQYLAAEMMNDENIKFSQFDFKNGGTLSELVDIHYNLRHENYDFIFWFPNVVDNNFVKLIPDKIVIPTSMLITSKNNLDGKYSVEELIQRALTTKSNLLLEINNDDSGLFGFRLFDPLMNIFYNGIMIEDLSKALVERLSYLSSITRQKTYPSTDDKTLVMKWYFDQFALEPESDSEPAPPVPDMPEFINLVHEYADIFTKLMPHNCNQERFIGNCSAKPNPVIGRCSKSMPSFRTSDNMIFVSKRNIDKAQIEIEHFVPVYMQRNNRLIYFGSDKPSVDTPIQIRLYEALPNIHFMIHSHCYLAKNPDYKTPCTNIINPCGAIEEADEILKLIDEVYKNRELNRYYINLKGHGSIIMGKTVDDLKNLSFVSRPIPEFAGSNKPITAKPISLSDRIDMQFDC